jgi:hypothetical protein
MHSTVGRRKSRFDRHTDEDGNTVDARDDSIDRQYQEAPTQPVFPPPNAEYPSHDVRKPSDRLKRAESSSRPPVEAENALFSTDALETQLHKVEVKPLGIKRKVRLRKN